MIVKNAGTIEKILLPPDFVAGKEEFGGRGMNWEKKFHPQNDQTVSIALYYRGMPVPSHYGEAFRGLTKRPPAVYFDEQGNNENQPDVVISLGDALGNAGNNQLTNNRSGISGPRFHIQLLKTMSIVGKPVVYVVGLFHSFDMVVSNYYAGIFVDATPSDERCRLEEIFIQAPTVELFEKYKDPFERAIATIQWASEEK